MPQSTSLGGEEGSGRQGEGSLALLGGVVMDDHGQG